MHAVHEGVQAWAGLGPHFQYGHPPEDSTWSIAASSFLIVKDKSHQRIVIEPPAQESREVDGQTARHGKQQMPDLYLKNTFLAIRNLGGVQGTVFCKHKYIRTTCCLGEMISLDN